jgi:tetratricopeptide (TPR) repeat protein
MNGADGHLHCLHQALALISSASPEGALSLLDAIPVDSALHPHALHLRGIAQAAQGRTADAIEAFEDALPWLARNEELLANLARAYAASSRFDDALTLLDKVADLGKASAATFSDRAALLEKLDKDALALDSYDAALRLDSGLYPAWAGRGNLLHKLGRYDEALSCHDRAVAMRPHDALARSSRASTLDKLGRMNEGLTGHQHAQALGPGPGQPAIWCGHGVCLVLLNRLEEGLHCFDQALEIDPSHLQAMINRASVLAELCRYEESLHQFDAALKCTAGGSSLRAKALCFTGMARLAVGDPAGWAGYEYRHHAAPELATRNAAAAQWSGTESLAGKRILLWSEQGFGDVIQFCRYTATLVELGATVLLEVPHPLLTLCAVLPAAVIVSKGADLPEHDFHIPMMSMPLALQRQPQLAGIPCPHGYLHADQRFIEKWRHAMPLSTRDFRIGIACSGALRHTRNAQRSIPLEKMLPLRAFADLVILQPELMPDDLSVAAGAPDIFRPSLDIDDFADVAGLIANVDLVISVDTSIAHLAGAMGVPVWILLPRNVEWRWMTDRADTPWYASARLFRQPARNDWDAVVREVLRALRT